MRLNSTGLGIGTSIIQGKLDIKTSESGFEFFPEHSTNTNLIINYDRINSNYLSIQTRASSHQFLIENTEKMRLTSTGLGIGTTSPSYPLEVNGEIKSDGYRIDLSSLSDIRAIVSTGTNSLQIGDSGVNEFKFKNLAGTSMIINSSGKVGIGTTSPTEKLHVVGKGIFTDQVTIPATPVATTDAASKSYVDAHGGGLGPFLPLTGGTLTGDLNLGTTSAPVDLYLFGDTAGTSLTWSNSDDELQFSDNTKVTFGDSGDLQVYYDGVDGAIKSATGIQFLANSATKMTLTSGGNLLIGTTSDSGQKLQVDGTAKIEQYFYINDIGNSNLFFIRNESNFASIDNGTRTLNFIGGDKIFLNGSFAEAMRIKSGGNVLIGTTTDGGKKLQINSDTTYDGIQITGANIPTLAIIDTTNNAKLVVYTRDNDATIGTETNHVFTFQTNAVERARFSTNGNLLLGTTTDSGAKLEISDSTSPDLILRNPTANPVNAGKIKFIESVNSDGFELTFNGFDNKFKFISNSSGTLTERLTIDRNNGNVGISANNPSAKLDIQSTTGNQLRIGYNDTAGWNLEHEAATGAFTFKKETSEKVRFAQNGNVLIGSTSDNGAKLQVTGIIRTSGGSVQAGLNYGFTLEDTSNSNRYGLKFGAAGSVGGSNLLMLTNRSLSDATGGGEVAIGANSSTTGVTETEVMRIKANTQSQVSIDGVLSLTKQDTPVDPPNNASTIWLDSNWDLKIKITNSSGDTVTKTIVEYA